MTISFTLGGRSVGKDTISGEAAHNPPVAVITSPVTGSTVNVSTCPPIVWTYNSPLSRVQQMFRVRILGTGSGAVLFDSGEIVGANVTYTPVFALASLASYQAEVTVNDGLDWSAAATTIFNSDISLTSYPTLATVGQLWEISINGQGYMLADHPDKDLKYSRKTVAISPERLATTDTPFSQAIDRYSFIGYQDFTGGGGQVRLDRPASDETRFLRSEGVNPFNSGALTLLPTTIQTVSSSYINPLLTVASSELYVLTNTNELGKQSTIGGATTTFNVAAATTVTALASDGEYWYAADGANIFRNNTAADPGGAWSTLDAKVMVWAADRICIAYANTGSAPNVFSTLTAAGAEEVGGGRLILQAGNSIVGIVGGAGYVYIATSKAGKGTVYAWQPGTTTTTIAYELPAGQECTAIGFYQGNVFLRTKETNPSGSRAIIYRMAPSGAVLIPVRLLELTDTIGTDHGAGAFSGDDRFALFSWQKMTQGGRSGLGCIDLSTGGYTTWLYAPSDAATGVVVAAVQWRGAVVFSIGGFGVCAESSTYLSTGFLDSGISDLATEVQKSLDGIQFSADQVPPGGTITLTYTVDNGNSYVSWAGLSVLTVGALRTAAGGVPPAYSVGIRITLTSTGVSTPNFRSAQVKVHPGSIADQVVVLPINCATTVEMLNGARSDRYFLNIVRQLEALAQTKVVLQDLDWADNPTVYEFEVVSCDTQTYGTFNTHKGKNDLHAVCVMTLRRPVFIG